MSMEDFTLRRAREMWRKYNLAPPRALYGYYQHGDWGGLAEEPMTTLGEALLSAHADHIGYSLRDPQWVYDGERLYAWADDSLEAAWCDLGLAPVKD